VKQHPDLVKKYMATVVPYTDNYFAALNSAVFSDGSFVYIPKGVRCPMELSTYFRINTANTGQFERTLIIADDHSYVSYLEGCTAPMRDENQLHAAIVEIIAMEDAEVKYSTVQNWYPGDKQGKGGVYNFVTKRGYLQGKPLQDLLDAGGNRVGHHLEIPLLRFGGRRFGGRVLLRRGHQSLPAGRYRDQDDSPGKNTRSASSRKGFRRAAARIATGDWWKVTRRAENARNHSQCDSLLLTDYCGAHTFPYTEINNPTAILEHEATTSKISEEQIFYCNQRGLDEEQAIGLIVNGYVKEVVNKLPMEFAVEAQKLLEISLEGSVG